MTKNKTKLKIRNYLCLLAFTANEEREREKKIGIKKNKRVHLLKTKLYSADRHELYCY